MGACGVGNPARKMLEMHFSEACSGLLVKLKVRLNSQGSGALIFHVSAFSWFDQTWKENKTKWGNARTCFFFSDFDKCPAAVLFIRLYPLR